MHWKNKKHAKLQLFYLKSIFEIFKISKFNYYDSKQTSWSARPPCLFITSASNWKILISPELYNRVFFLTKQIWPWYRQLLLLFEDGCHKSSVNCTRFVNHAVGWVCICIYQKVKSCYWFVSADYYSGSSV